MGPSGWFGRATMHADGWPPDSGVAVLAIVLRFVVWVLLILAALWVIREIFRMVTQHRWTSPPPTSPAVHELDLLYARGEVSREQYLSRRADLLGSGGVPGGVAPPGAAPPPAL